MPEKTVLVPFRDRKVEMRKPTEGALMVLARVSKSLPTIENGTESDITEAVRAKVLRNLATIGSIVDAMIVTDDDKEWVEEGMISGEVPLEDVFDSIRIAGEMFNEESAAAAPKKAAKSVRRR